MPRIWADSIGTHRQQVHEAILAAAAAIAAEQGPLALSMSSIAERAGIGRATLYKYFRDIESVFMAWHARDVAHYGERLRRLSLDPKVTLKDVAAFITERRRHHPHLSGADVVGTLAQAVADMAGEGRDEVTTILVDLLTNLAARRQVRRDYPPDELAAWVFHAVHAPASLGPAAVADLVIGSLAPRTR